MPANTSSSASSVGATRIAITESAPNDRLSTTSIVGAVTE